MTASLRSEFLLDPDVSYLNHGGFGACSREVFQVYQDWQRQLEWNPTRFVQLSSTDYLKHARAALGAYLHTDPGNLVFYQNPTMAANMIIHSLDLKPGDEILTSNYEYGAMNNTWEYYCQRWGANYIHQEIPLPVHDAEEIVDALFAGVTSRTRMIFFSHITSPTAMIYPAAAICERARALGIPTFIDGAHAVAQVPVDFAALGCDYYGAACHKWLCAPKGSAFAYVAPQHQEGMAPLTISTGWPRCGFNQIPTGSSSLVHYQEYQGTRDIAAFLAVPAAIEYQAKHDWEAQRERCHQLAVETEQRICAMTGMQPFSTAPDAFFRQFVAVPLPKGDLSPLVEKLKASQIVVPAFELPQMGCNCIRVSYQAYNDESDMEKLLAVMQEYTG